MSMKDQTSIDRGDALEEAPIQDHCQSQDGRKAIASDTETCSLKALANGAVSRLRFLKVSKNSTSNRRARLKDLVCFEFSIPNVLLQLLLVRQKHNFDLLGQEHKTSSGLRILHPFRMSMDFAQFSWTTRETGSPS